MKNELIDYKDMEFHKIHGCKVYVFGVKPGILRDTYFDITHDLDTGDIIEENIFKKFLELNPNNPMDKKYFEKREFLKGLK